MRWLPLALLMAGCASQPSHTIAGDCAGFVPMPVTRIERVFLGFEADKSGRLTTVAPNGMPQAVWDEMRVTYRSIKSYNAFGRVRCGWADTGDVS